MSIFSKVTDLYEEMWKAIIRPPRDLYSIEQLGPPQFCLGNRRYRRRDFELINQRGLTIQCSHFEPVESNGRHDNNSRPCVIYMHGNCSSRMEAIHCGCLRVLLPLDVTILCFDFTGSGLSEGDYVSLGWYEREDLEKVVEHLRTIPTVSTIGLWGRSMGAVTACLFAEQDPSIAGLVVDSPFSSLRCLAEELAADFVGWKMPKFILGPAMNMIKNSVMQKANFDLDQLEPIRHCGSSFVPALFIAAKDDVFIRPHHAGALHDAYAGDKNFILVEGNHNSYRPEFLHDSIAIFFRFALQLGEFNSRNSVWEEVATAMAMREQQRRQKLERIASEQKRQGSTTSHQERINSSTSSNSEVAEVEHDPFDLASEKIAQEISNAMKSTRSEKYHLVKELGNKRLSSEELKEIQGQYYDNAKCPNGNGFYSQSIENRSMPSGINNNVCSYDNNGNSFNYEDFRSSNEVIEFREDIAQQYAIWMSFRSNQKEEDYGITDDSQEVKKEHQLISEVIDVIPEANIEEMLGEFLCEEDLIGKEFESSVSSMNNNELYEESSSSSYPNRLKMIAPHRVSNETLLPPYRNDNFIPSSQVADPMRLSESAFPHETPMDDDNNSIAKSSRSQSFKFR